MYDLGEFVDVGCARFIEDVNAFRDFMAAGIEQIQTDEAQVV
ncbi:MAG: hypothetical protein ACF8OB_16090 [Phycisphaeraceae bacterium JB051]